MKNIKLDKKQKKVIKNISKNLLVIAGAGSGKTLTIIYKIKKLIKDQINPDKILCLTFTKSAANSLRKKLLKENININVYTFHSLGYQIIKKSKNVNLTKENTLDKIILNHLSKYPNLNDLIGATFIELGNGNVKKLQNEILKQTPHITYLKEVIKTFINLFKSNNYNLSSFNTFFKINKKQNYIKKRIRHNKFLNLAKNIYQDYEDYLSFTKKIDYHDMINEATKIVETEGIYPYKYIIIDEYQDTSLNKCELIKTIQNKTDANLIAVGDDWQSIYRFTGSNLDIFTEFKQYFSKTKIIKLNKTYRNSKQLTKVAKKFILKNPYQITKKVTSSKKEKKPIHIYYYEKNIKEIWDKVISELNGETFVLGRNNKDIKKIPYLNKKMKYMTVHKSKGLESENIIIINLENKTTGFPSKIKDSEYLTYVIPKDDNYPFAEERRLFYVALTRTKSKVILIVKKNLPSIFVTELIKDSNQYIKINN